MKKKQKKKQKISGDFRHENRLVVGAQYKMWRIYGKEEKEKKEKKDFACAYLLRVIRITTSEQLSCVPTDNIVYI